MHLIKSCFNKDSTIQCLGTVSDHIERIYRRAGSKKLWFVLVSLSLHFICCVVIFNSLKIIDQS